MFSNKQRAASSQQPACRRPSPAAASPLSPALSSQPQPPPATLRHPPRPTHGQAPARVLAAKGHNKARCVRVFARARLCASVCDGYGNKASVCVCVCVCVCGPRRPGSHRGSLSGSSGQSAPRRNWWHSRRRSARRTSAAACSSCSPLSPGPRNLPPSPAHGRGATMQEWQ